MSKCNICGSEVSPHDKICPVCGQTLIPEESNVKIEGGNQTNLETNNVTLKEDENSNQPTEVESALTNEQETEEQPTKPRKKDSISIGYGIISFILPLIGLIMFCSWRDDYPKRSKSCLVGFVIGVCLSVLAKICFALYMKSMRQ